MLHVGIFILDHIAEREIDRGYGYPGDGIRAFRGAGHKACSLRSIHVRRTGHRAGAGR